MSPSRRILIIEDDQDSREMLGYLLKLSGHEVFEAPEGAHGIALAERESPDVVLVDVGLPGLDGYEVARQLRASPAGAHMLLLALTGHGLPEDRRRAIDAGFDDHLVKPVDPERLNQALSIRDTPSRS
jgi:CheY-like chemotaxis protein